MNTPYAERGTSPYSHPIMSKSKVPFNHLICPLFFTHRPRRNHVYITSLLKTLHHFCPFPDKCDKDKALKSWSTPMSIPELLSFADRLYDEDQFVEAYELLNKIRLVNEPEVLWRLARAIYSLSLDEDVEQEASNDMIDEAQKLLKIALDVGGDSSASVHKWLAVVLDRAGAATGLERRVGNAALVRDHLRRACHLCPADFSAHHMLGRWHFQMSRLTWFQRNVVAKYLLAGVHPPASSYKRAYKYLSKAEDLQPRAFLPNLYLLGKTCLETGQYYKAKYYLHLATTLPPKDECDECCAKKARRLAMKLDRYDLGKNVLYYDPLGFID